MIKGQILWDLRALIYMGHSQSFIVESFNRELKVYLESHDRSWTLSVRSFHSLRNGVSLNCFPAKDTEEWSDREAIFSLKYVDLRKCLTLEVEM